MTARRRRFAILFGLLLILVNCRGSGPGELRNEQRTTLLVQNQSSSDMRVYAVYGAQRVRLGYVTGTRTQRLTVPSAIVSGGRELVFEANPLASDVVASSVEIYVAPGDEITMTIPPTVR